MTEEQARYGIRLVGRIERLQWMLEEEVHDDDAAYPQTMIDRHRQEKREYLEAELACLQAELDDL